MNALVTGGNGFIGAHLVDGLLKDGWMVRVLDRKPRADLDIAANYQFIQGDIETLSPLQDMLSGTDIVFHLAWSGIPESSNKDFSRDVQRNVLPAIQLMEACVQARVQKFLFVSSGGAIYGPTKAISIPEDHTLNPINSYGISKMAVEKYLHLFHHIHGLNYGIIRPSVPYGPRQNPLARQGAIPIFLYRIAKGLPITIWGDGSIKRDFFFIDDLTRLLLLSADLNLSQNQIFNAGGQEEISLNQVVELAEAVVGKQAIVEFKESRKFDVSRVLLDTSRAHSALGWEPTTSLYDGMSQTWQWLQRFMESV